ncbi:ThuA domain-containing protein [Phenylobacterium sp.]|uniref:ThuA domain-containing protein n=1 Tax=Phenylobacterium sp. TaxID=1871053 RepID=UPI00286CCD27|nr:ThuA domain-containing protein [Phenylobacterium sp.]
MASNLLVVTKGHPFDHNAFHALFDANADIVTTFVEQPAAQVILRPENVGRYDAVLFYDMLGIPMDPNDLASAQPSADYASSIESLLARGVGLILLNHALVQWPLWPLWREITGSTFRLTQGEVDGRQVPGSGYRGGAGEPHRNATHRLSPLGAPHPVTRGLESGFEITDELYLRTPLARTPDIVPLMASDYAFTQANFSPPPLAPKAEQAAWAHEDGDNIIIWARRVRNSPVVASEAGDGPAAYENPGFRRLLANAIQWVTSDEARAWARNSRPAE